MKKILVTIILGMFFLSLVSAATVFPQDEEVNITVTCLNEGYCSSNSFCNINLIDSEGVLLIQNQNMTNHISVHTQNYTFTSLGDYKVEGFCQDGVYSEEINFIIEITPTGILLSIPTAILYLGFIFILIIIFLTSMYFGVTIPYRNSRGMQGELISVNDLKYVKILSLFIAYSVFIWIANLMISLSSNYLTQTVVLGFFKMVFSISIALFYPILVFTIIFIVIQAVKDFNLKKLLGGGFKV